MNQQDKVLTVVDKSTKAFGAAASNLVKILNELGSIPDAVGELTTEIEFKQSELNQITASIETASREAAAEIRLRIREDEQTVLNELLDKGELAYIKEADLQLLQEELRDATLDNEDAIGKAVRTAEQALHIQYDAKLSEAKSEHAVAVAQKDADLTAKDNEISFLQRQVTSLEKTIEAERQARVDIAASEANRQGVTVNTTSK